MYFQQSGEPSQQRLHSCTLVIEIGLHGILPNGTPAGGVKVGGFMLWGLIFNSVIFPASCRHSRFAFHPIYLPFNFHISSRIPLYCRAPNPLSPLSARKSGSVSFSWLATFISLLARSALTGLPPGFYLSKIWISCGFSSPRLCGWRGGFAESLTQPDLNLSDGLVRLRGLWSKKLALSSTLLEWIHFLQDSRSMMKFIYDYTRKCSFRFKYR